MCVCVTYVYIYIYTHTHTHTYTTRVFEQRSMTMEYTAGILSNYIYI